MSVKFHPNDSKYVMLLPVKKKTDYLYYVTLVFLLIYLLTIHLAAETRTYLVKRHENFPQDRYLLTYSPLEYKRFINTGKKDIAAAHGQPFRITSYELNYNGKYALWNVSYKDTPEMDSLNSMEAQKYIVLLSTLEVINTYDPRIGGSRTEARYTVLSELPTDYYVVEVSTQ